MVINYHDYYQNQHGYDLHVLSIWAQNYAEGEIKMIGKDEPLVGIG